MISSPCKGCPKVGQPKSVCSKNCQILKMVQEVQLTKEFEGVMSVAEYSDMDMYTVNHTYFSALS